LPGHLVREVGAARGYDDLAAVRFAQDGRHHAGTAKRVGQVWQRLSLRASERCHEEAE
jgi:hypothetical protein